MFLASKIGWVGIALALLTGGILARELTRRAAGHDSNKAGVAAFVIKDEIKKMQETLHDKGHYPGNVDGVFGLRTRASIREYQKAENLPATGQVDRRTADGLGVRPEAAWDNSERAGREVGHGGGEINAEKPSAGIRWAEGRASKTLRKRVSKAAAIEGTREDDK